jgi:hypothetical protein
MKTAPILSSFAALGALFLFPLSFEIYVSVFFTAGLVGLVISDYAEAIRPRPMCRVPATVPRSALERFRLAA